MTLSTNDDFSNRELSIEELEAIAAGWPSWVHSAVHGIEHGIDNAVHWIESPSGKNALARAGGAVVNYLLHLL
jgi:hypothetical protein